jgi:SSS family solute:Na+ symporter
MQSLFGFSEPVHFLHTLGLVFVLTILLMIVISFLRPATGSSDVEISGRPQVVDMTPWRYSRVAGLLITAITIGCYVILAQ